MTACWIILVATVTFGITVNVHVTLKCLNQLSASVIAPLFQQQLKEDSESIQLL